MDLLDFLDVFVRDESSGEACAHVSCEDDAVGGCEAYCGGAGFVDVFEVGFGEVAVWDFSEFWGIWGWLIVWLGDMVWCGFVRW